MASQVQTRMRHAGPMGRRFPNRHGPPGGISGKQKPATRTFGPPVKLFPLIPPDLTHRLAICWASSIDLIPVTHNNFRHAFFGDDLAANGNRLGFED